RYQGKGEINDLNLYWSFAFLHGPEASTVDYDAGKASPTLPQNYLSFRGGGFVPTGFGLVGVLLEYQAGQESRQEETLFGVTETFVIKKNDRYITEIHAEWDHPYHPSLTLVHQRIEHGE